MQFMFATSSFTGACCLPALICVGASTNSSVSSGSESLILRQFPKSAWGVQKVRSVSDLLCSPQKCLIVVEELGKFCSCSLAVYWWLFVHERLFLQERIVRLAMPKTAVSRNTSPTRTCWSATNALSRSSKDCFPLVAVFQMLLFTSL